MRFVLPEGGIPAADAALKPGEVPVNDGLASVAESPLVKDDDFEYSVDGGSGGADVTSGDMERGTGDSVIGDFGGFDATGEDFDSKISDDGSLFGDTGELSIEPELGQGEKSDGGGVDDGGATLSEDQLFWVRRF